MIKLEIILIYYHGLISRLHDLKYEVFESIDSFELPEEFMLEFKDYLIWNDLCSDQVFSYDFIKNNHNLLNMKIISRNKKFTEHQIRELKDNLDWKILSIFQDLSEDIEI